MDFNKFDNRKKAEQGSPLQLLDPDTREPITSGGKPCRVIVRGTISKQVQSSIRQRLREQVVQENKTIAGETAEAKALRKADIKVMEDVHQEAVESTLPFVMGFENIERGGEPLDPNNEDDVRWLLNLTFPVIGPELDDKGEPLMDEVEDDETKKMVKRPKLKVMNLPFTKQVQDFAAKLGSEMGNGSTT